MSNWRQLTRSVMGICRNVLSESIEYTCSGLTQITINAIVDYESHQIDPNTGAVIISNQPMVGVKDLDLPKRPDVGDTCIVRGISYQIVERIEDGQAGTRLRLNQA